MAIRKPTLNFETVHEDQYLFPSVSQIINPDEIEKDFKIKENSNI